MTSLKLKNKKDLFYSTNLVFHFVFHERKENCLCSHIPFNVTSECMYLLCSAQIIRKGVITIQIWFDATEIQFTKVETLFDKKNTKSRIINYCKRFKTLRIFWDKKKTIYSHFCREEGGEE